MTETTELVVTPKTSKLAATRDFFIEARTEMDKVSWPSKPELIKATRAVVVGSLILGVCIGLLDWVLQKLLVDLVAMLAR